MSVNWEGIAEFLGYRIDQIDEVKKLKLPPYDPEELDVVRQAHETFRRLDAGGPAPTVVVHEDGNHIYTSQAQGIIAARKREGAVTTFQLTEDAQRGLTLQDRPAPLPVACVRLRTSWWRRFLYWLARTTW